MRPFLLAAALLTAPLAATAQERPQLFPTRDVAVTFRVAGQGQQAELTMLWSAAQRLMRTNLPQGAGYMVVDHNGQRAFMVMEAMRMVMDVPIEQATAQQRYFETARFTRGGTERVAGHDCTVWRYQSGSGESEACITSDGVLLRGQGSAAGGGSGRIEAVRVVFAPQDASLFRRPQGYQTMQMPQGMPGQRPTGPR
jgi:hypothetical protein